MKNPILPKKTAKLGRWVIGASCIFLYSKCYAEEGALYDNQIVVEHAEIMLPSPGRDKYSGYFSIWNGTSDYLWITDFKSTQFSGITLNEPISGINAKLSQPALFPKALPPKTELVMSIDGIRLTMENVGNLNAGDTIPFTVKFTKADAIEVGAKILPAIARPTEHHHGERDG